MEHISDYLFEILHPIVKDNKLLTFCFHKFHTRQFLFNLFNIWIFPQDCVKPRTQTHTPLQKKTQNLLRHPFCPGSLSPHPLRRSDPVPHLIHLLTLTSCPRMTLCSPPPPPLPVLLYCPGPKLWALQDTQPPAHLAWAWVPSLILLPLPAPHTSATVTAQALTH